MDRNEQISRLKDVQIKSRSKRIRSYFSPAQTKKMEDVFAVDPFPDKDQIKQLSTMLDISDRSLQVWFQNRRARQRKARPEANQELIGLRSSRSCYQYPSSSGYPFDTTCMPIFQDIKRKGEESIERLSIESQQTNVSSPHTSPTRTTSRIELPKTPLVWHRTQPNTPIKKPTISPHKHSIDDSDFLSPSPKRQRLFPVQYSDVNSTEPKVKCSNLTDDYKYMQSNYLYQTSPGFRNFFETPNHKNKNCSLSLSPDDNTILNLCTRDPEKGFKATSPIVLSSPEKTPPKPASVQSPEIYPHWNAHLAYGCPPGFPPMPPQAVAQYYAALYHYHMNMEAQYGEMLKSQMTSFPGLHPPFPVPKLKNMYESIPEPENKLSKSEKLVDNVDKA